MGTLKTLQQLIEENGGQLNHERFAVTVWPQSHTAGKKCPLISDYSDNRTDAGQVVQDLVGNPFASPALEPSSKQVNLFKKHAPALFLPVELRLKTLAAIEHVKDHRSDTNCWKYLYRQYFDFFGLNGIDALPDTNSCYETAALRAIQASDDTQTKSVGKALSDALCVSGIPKGDPAKAFLIDTVAHLLQVNRRCSTWPPQEDFSSQQYFPPGTTWVVLGSEQALQYVEDGLIDKAETYGILGLLRLEKVLPPTNEAVVGTIYPHPLLAWSAPLDQFWNLGIQHAFQATYDEKASGYDIRWHVEPVSMSSGCQATLLKLLLKGGWWGSSQTTAFAAAIHSLRQNIPLRSDVVASALFKRTEIMDLHQELLPVGRTEEKTTADFQKNEWDLILSEPLAKRPRLEKQVTELIIAKGQSHKLIRSDMVLVKCGSFHNAFQRMSLFEKWSREHADQVSENWTQSDSADEERLDLFQWPHLHWEQPKQPDVRGQSKWVRKKIEGTEDQPLAEILRTLHKKKKHLLIHDGAGAGKTVLSQRMEHLFSSEQSFAKFFPNAPRPLVVRWTKRTFPETGGIQRLEDLLMADAVIRSICRKKSDRRNWIRNAMDLERVVILVDGLDEMPDEQRNLLREKFFAKLDPAHQETPERRREAKVLWIVLGRPNTIRDERRMYGGSSNWLQDSHFLRVRLGLFDEEQQDNYFRAALSRSDTPKSPALAEGVAATNPPPVSNSWEQWRRMVKKIPKKVSQRILGLPDTLREMLRLIESHLGSDRRDQPWPQFRSLPDLFLKTSIPLLEKNLPKLQDLTPDIRGPEGIAQQRKVIELAVCAVAFEMWIQDQRVSTRPTGNQTHEKLVSEIETEAEERFLQVCAVIWRRQGEQTRMRHWQWAYPRAKQIVMNYFSKDESEKTASLSFRNRRVHEQYVARYLTQYATAEDCGELPQHVGNPEWDKLWRFVITTPLEGSEEGRDVHGAEPEKYGAALERLFYRPKNPNWRRPTKLMWLADQQCRRFEMKAPDDQSNIFRAARRKFREILHQQFLAILNQNSDLKKRKIAQSLIDPDTYQILGQESGSGLDGDTGRFRMGDEEKDKKEVTLSRFGMQKLLISNTQFQLFDDSYLGRKEDRDRFGNDDQPAVYVSWYDAWWFSRFVGEVVVKGQTYQVTLPTEAQWEYSARAGSNGEFFRAALSTKKIIEVTEDLLPEYAHYRSNRDSPELTLPVTSKQPNLWGLRMTGNAWQWTLDGWQLSILGGPDPLVTGGMGSDRVLRGGSWFYEAADCRSALRYRIFPSLRDYDFGFRVALSPSGIPRAAELQSGIKID